MRYNRRKSEYLIWWENELPWWAKPIHIFLMLSVAFLPVYSRQLFGWDLARYTFEIFFLGMVVVNLGVSGLFYLFLKRREK